MLSSSAGQRIEQHPRMALPFLRKLFGLVWGVDAVLKFLPNSPFWFSERVLAASIGQPPWLRGWFQFWVSQSTAYASADTYGVAVLELALAASLIGGVLRKTGYLGGFGLSLAIWAVPEGFGGPYEQGSFDIGVGVIYAIAFLLLLALEANRSANRGTIDRWVEARLPSWSWWAEVTEQDSP